MTLLGCGKSDPKPSAGAPTASTKGERAKLSVPAPKPHDLPSKPLAFEVDGVKQPVKTAVAYTTGGRAITVLVSTRELTCDWLSPPSEPAADDVYIAFRVGVDPRSTKAQEVWQFSKLFGQLRSGTGKMFQLGLAGGYGKARMLTADVSKGGTTKVRVEIDHKHDRPPANVSLIGDVEARGCGDVRLAESKPRPQAIEARVGNTEYRIVGATVHTVKALKSWTLLLTTAPTSCEDLFPVADAQLSLQLLPQGNKITDLSLGGASFPAYMSTELVGDEAPEFGASGSFEGEGTVELTIPSLSAKNPSGYPVSMQGRVEALKCGTQG